MTDVCYDCYIDRVNPKHLPRLCDSINCNARVVFGCYYRCQEQCGHILVPMCLLGHVCKPRLSRHCSQTKKILEIINQ